MEKNNLTDTPIEKCKGKEVKIDIDEETNSSNSLIVRRKEESKMEIDIDEESNSSNTSIVVRLKPASKCCIYRVPTNLRKINEEAYTPQLISIGPFHYEKDTLAKMEKQKIRYKEDFGKRLNISTKEKWQGLIDFIKGKEQDIRACYDEEITHLDSEKFRKMILFDAIFIIELFLKNFDKLKKCQEKDSLDFLLKNPCLESGIRLDLQLIENQLPFFVLKELYVSSFPIHPGLLGVPSFEFLSLVFFNAFYERDDVFYEGEFQHFVDLRRNFLVKNLQCREGDGQIHDLPSAVKLHESGVKFESRKDYKHLLDIKLDEVCGCCLPCFKVDKLQIPHITIEDNTECLFRNMMALEQCHYSSETHICSYIDLMDSLINTEKDVDLLIEKGIITNFVGDHDAIAKMFNKLCLQITPSDSCYKDISEDLKRHHKTWWNRTKATLMRVYFNNLWRGTGTIAAIILLVLTLLQTIYAMKG